MNAFCCSVNVDEVVNLCGGGGDTSTLHALIKLSSDAKPAVSVSVSDLYLFAIFTI